ncbi:hypothetical protein QJS10_CPB18g00719 [Acorus calamus]|uniref:Uncharacterized protein n=1 Tax=Acorus calamus TaxID=4465 RepID=A0AAV9CN70_ACOCL|nr:hypothetical protein QJS10_CPB18g00719 [Acorus calamus]
MDTPAPRGPVNLPSITECMDLLLGMTIIPREACEWSFAANLTKDAKNQSPMDLLRVQHGNGQVHKSEQLMVFVDDGWSWCG